MPLKILNVTAPQQSSGFKNGNFRKTIHRSRARKWETGIYKHLKNIQKMLPFFHAAGHFFHTKCAHMYLQDMLTLEERMDPLEFQLYTKSEYFKIRRTKKFWCGVCSDMMIEQVLMRSMKSYGGLTRGRGVTVSVLTRWTWGNGLPRKHMHRCGKLL